VTLIERCIEFWTSFVPDFPQKIRGADAQAIANVERVTKRPLSPVYREFLERMSEDTGPLNLGLYDTSPGYLVDERWDVLERLPLNAELFASPTADDEQDIFLVHGEGSDPVVMRHAEIPRTNDGLFARSKAEAVAGSLTELLCLPALNQYYSLQQPFRWVGREKERHENTFEHCKELAKGWRLTPYWFSNDQCLAARLGNLVLVAKQAPGFLFSVGIAGPEEHSIADISETLRRELDLY